MLSYRTLCIVLCVLLLLFMFIFPPRVLITIELKEGEHTTALFSQYHTNEGKIVIMTVDQKTLEGDTK